MSNFYQAVNWNRQKRIYDLSLLGGVVLYIALFTLTTFARDPNATAETTLIRALGTGALLLLHVILCHRARCAGSIAVFCRCSTTAATSASRCSSSRWRTRPSPLFQFHALGDVNPLVSLLTGDPCSTDRQFPFELLGLAALAILFLMAATSHDFWLANLTAPVWKTLHMLVYVAYALLIVPRRARRAAVRDRARARRRSARRRDGDGSRVFTWSAGWREREPGRERRIAGRRRLRRRVRASTRSRKVARASSGRAASASRCSATTARSPRLQRVPAPERPAGRRADRGRAASPVPGTATSTGRTVAARRRLSPRRSPRSTCGFSRGEYTSIPNPTHRGRGSNRHWCESETGDGRRGRGRGTGNGEREGERGTGNATRGCNDEQILLTA